MTPDPVAPVPREGEVPKVGSRWHLRGVEFAGWIEVIPPDGWVMVKDQSGRPFPVKIAGWGDKFVPAPTDEPRP